MILAAKIIGTGLATTGLIGAGVGAGFLTVASQPEQLEDDGTLIIVVTTEVTTTIDYI